MNESNTGTLRLLALTAIVGLITVALGACGLGGLGENAAGDVVTLTFTAPAGTTGFTCTWHEEQAMVGRIEAEQAP
jgi:hypothetical protein